MTQEKRDTVPVLKGLTVQKRRSQLSSVVSAGAPAPAWRSLRGSLHRVLDVTKVPVRGRRRAVFPGGGTSWSRSAQFCQLITRIQSVLSICSALVQGCVGSGFHAPHVDWESSKQTACIKLLSALRPHPGEIPNVLPDSVSIWHTTISIHCSCSCTCGLVGMWLMLAEPP